MGRGHRVTSGPVRSPLRVVWLSSCFCCFLLLLSYPRKFAPFPRGENHLMGLQSYSRGLCLSRDKYHILYLSCTPTTTGKSEGERDGEDWISTVRGTNCELATTFLRLLRGFSASVYRGWRNPGRCTRDPFRPRSEQALAPLVRTRGFGLKPGFHDGPRMASVAAFFRRSTRSVSRLPHLIEQLAREAAGRRRGNGGRDRGWGGLRERVDGSGRRDGLAPDSVGFDPVNSDWVNCDLVNSD
jgi:hypothetical protein